MIFTDITEAIGSTLLEIRQYENKNPIDSEFDSYTWDVLIFNTGLLCLERQCCNYDGCIEKYTTSVNEYI